MIASPAAGGLSLLSQSARHKSSLLPQNAVSQTVVMLNTTDNLLSSRDSRIRCDYAAASDTGARTWRL